MSYQLEAANTKNASLLARPPRLLFPPLFGFEKHAPFARERISINVEIAEAHVVIEKLACLFKR
jgi:hypothetical protein